MKVQSTKRTDTMDEDSPFNANEKKDSTEMSLLSSLFTSSYGSNRSLQSLLGMRCCSRYVSEAGGSTGRVAFLCLLGDGGHDSSAA